MELLITPEADAKSDAFELNENLFNIMEIFNFHSQEWNNIFRLPERVRDFLSRNYEFKYKLFNSLVLCVTPLLSSKTEWDELLNGDTNKLADSFALAPRSFNDNVRMQIKYENRFYLTHLISRARFSPLAMMELGVSFETIQILRDITVEQKNNALRFKLPLFKWRYPTELFSAGHNDFEESSWLMHLIQSAPIPLKDLNPKSDLGKTYRVEVIHPLVMKLVHFNMRATIITTLMPNVSAPKVRQLYRKELSKSSSCGKLPYSETWYFLTERRRLHSSLYMLLYRLAVKSGLDHIYSVTAAYAWYLELAPEDPIKIDRLAKLANAVQSGSGQIHVAACRSCSANYLLCNTKNKREYATTYHCPQCEKRRQKAA